MAEYSLHFKESVEKDFRAISRKDARRIINRIDLLAAEPRPPGCEKLTGRERYRIRQRRYRIVYSIQDSELTVWIVRVGRRKDVYR